MDKVGLIGLGNMGHPMASQGPAAATVPATGARA